MQVEPLALPKPPGFDASAWSWRLVLAFIMFGGFGILFTVLGVRAAMNGHWFHLMFYVPTAAVFSVPLCVMLIRGVSPDVTTFNEFVAAHGNGEFAVERSTRATLIYCGCLATVIVGAASFAIGVPTGAMRLDLSTGQQITYPIAIGGLGIFFLRALVTVASRGTSGWLRLSPAGIDHMEPGAARRTIAWDDIREITVVPPARKKRFRPPNRDRGYLIPVAESDRPVAIALGWPMGNRATYWLIHFYLTHPEFRDELGDDRVVDRIQAGDIVDT